MPKKVKVYFAGREYQIGEKNSGPASVWRTHLIGSRTMRIFQSLDGAIEQIARAFDNVLPGDKEQSISVSSVITLAELLPVVVNGLSHSMDEIKDMLFDYSPELEADKEWIEANGYDSEITSAFVEVLKLCYPFLEVLALLRGPKEQPIATNLPSRNGASGQKSIGHRPKAKA